MVKKIKNRNNYKKRNDTSGGYKELKLKDTEYDIIATIDGNLVVRIRPKTFKKYWGDLYNLNPNGEGYYATLNSNGYIKPVALREPFSERIDDYLHIQHKETPKTGLEITEEYNRNAQERMSKAKHLADVAAADARTRKLTLLNTDVAKSALWGGLGAWAIANPSMGIPLLLTSIPASSVVMEMGRNTVLPHLNFRTDLGGELLYSYLWPRYLQEKGLEDRGYTKEDESKGYGILNKDGIRNLKEYRSDWLGHLFNTDPYYIPLYRKYDNEANSEDLISIGNVANFSENNPEDKATWLKHLTHSYHDTSQIFVDERGNAYYDTWDLNNYGDRDLDRKKLDTNIVGAGKEGRQATTYGSSQGTANTVDRIGNPVAVHTGVLKTPINVMQVPTSIDHNAVTGDKQIDALYDTYNKYWNNRGYLLEALDDNTFGIAPMLTPVITPNGNYAVDMQPRARLRVWLDAGSLDIDDIHYINAVIKGNTAGPSTFNKWSTGGQLNNNWNALDINSKKQLMKDALDKGITDINIIKRLYNSKFNTLEEPQAEELFTTQQLYDLYNSVEGKYKNSDFYPTKSYGNLFVDGGDTLFSNGIDEGVFLTEMGKSNNFRGKSNTPDTIQLTKEEIERLKRYVKHQSFDFSHLEDNKPLENPTTFMYIPTEYISYLYPELNLRSTPDSNINYYLDETLEPDEDGYYTLNKLDLDSLIGKFYQVWKNNQESMLRIQDNPDPYGLGDDSIPLDEVIVTSNKKTGKQINSVPTLGIEDEIVETPQKYENKLSVYDNPYNSNGDTVKAKKGDKDRLGVGNGSVNGSNDRLLYLNYSLEVPYLLLAYLDSYYYNSPYVNILWPDNYVLPDYSGEYDSSHNEIPIEYLPFVEDNKLNIGELYAWIQNELNKRSYNNGEGDEYYLPRRSKLATPITITPLLEESKVFNNKKPF